MNIKQYVKKNSIRVEVVRDRGTQVEDGWEHHAYVLRLVWDDGSQSRFLEDVKWSQGHGVQSVPQDEPAQVLDALISDANAYDEAQSFEDFCATFGYDEDSRKAEKLYRECGEISKKLAAFLGGRDELERVTYKIERL